jgi:hypothetical protein
MSEKSMLDKINETLSLIYIDEIIKDKNDKEGYYYFKRNKKRLLKKYLNDCQTLLFNDVENQIKQLSGTELINFIKHQANKKVFGTIASLEDDIKKISKNKIDGYWFSFVYLISIFYFEQHYNTKIINSSDFMELNKK